jgi:methylmalonyl-CoA mutase cobalamin-binding subunit
MLASVLAAEAGWRVVYLGPSLPAAEIARASATAGAAVVAVSVVNEFTGAVLLAELGALRAALRPDVRLLVGGHGATVHRDVLTRVAGLEVGDLALLRETLPVVEEVDS